MLPIAAFRKKFKIDSKADLRSVATAVEAIYKADAVASEYLGNINPQNGAEGFRVHSLMNLLGRVFEHAQAMLVAIATGSPASAEALARIVVEGSINTMYLGVMGNPGTLVRFFRSWISEHDRKLTEWKEQIQNEDYADEVGKMIDSRRQMVMGLSSYLSQVESQYSIDSTMASSEWPKSIFKRFAALGRETDYYESYHRLSGASHITGEDTLTWLIALEMPNDQRYLIGKEALAYSVMMTRISSMFFVDAVAACVIQQGRDNNDDLKTCKFNLSRAVHEIGREAGVPIADRSAAA